jgi:hypothetical protein
MENFETAQFEKAQMDEHFPKPTEDEFTKTIEQYTAAIPSSAYLGVAVAAMGVSLLCQVAGRGNGETSSRNGSRRG